MLDDLALQIPTFRFTTNKSTQNSMISRKNPRDFLCLTLAIATAFNFPSTNGFSPKNVNGLHHAAVSTKSTKISPSTAIEYRSETNVLDESAIMIDSHIHVPVALQNLIAPTFEPPVGKDALDMSNIEFVSPARVEAATEKEGAPVIGPFPFAMMLQGSAHFIAEHSGKTAVFHIPGDLIDKPGFGSLIDDIALSWLLGLKIVIVMGCRSGFDGCAMDFEHAHECHNSIRVTDSKMLRQVEEEAGFVRFEVERRLNRSLRKGIMKSMDDVNGNVVGGNFYTTRPYGNIGGRDCKHTGYTSGVHVENIKKALYQNNDIVLLTTIASSNNGELINVNGNHLAASVATELHAHKLIFMSNEGRVVRKKGESEPLQDIPLSFTKSLTDHYNVKVNKAGFAAFEHARQTLEPGAVELLLHLGWASWAVERGVTRAHVVNPGDGALLEELFTRKHGSNTCLFHDNELTDDSNEDFVLSETELSSFFSQAEEQGAHFK
jgi:acetylglutamate kinase